MVTIRKYHVAAGLILVSIFSLLSLENCSQNEKAPANRPEQGRFAGSQACAQCHKDIYDQHLQSFHHLTSAQANSQTLKGDFDSANKYFINDHLLIAAERKQDSFFQTAYSHGVPKLTRPFDMVVGSGKRGQTSIYWFQNYLFQLPLTWFTETGEWTISPGYSRKADFNRSITARCLECHSTYFQETTNKDSKADEFSMANYVLGVECERCHGPASEHIAFYQQHPEDSAGHAATGRATGRDPTGQSAPGHTLFNPAKATRQQSLDLCRLCHGGALTKSKSSFSFQPGDKLFDFFQPDTAKPIAQMDVHGNQYGMLAASKCFQLSQMTCLSCHDGHKNESKQAAQFYAKCETCHSSASHNECRLALKVPRDMLTTNCINCHMPEEASKAIMVLRQGESIPTSAHMRSHYIAVYKDISNKILSVQK